MEIGAEADFDAQKASSTAKEDRYVYALTRNSKYENIHIIHNTEKIDWNNSPKTISSEWIWTPPTSPKKDGEEEEIEELKLPAVSSPAASNSKTDAVSSLTKGLGSLGLNDKKKNKDMEKKEERKSIADKKKPEPEKKSEKKPEKKPEKKSEKSKLRANAPEFTLRATAPSFTPGGYRPAPRPAVPAFRPRGYPQMNMQHHYRMQGGMPINPQTGKPMTPQEIQFLQRQQYAAMMQAQQRNTRPYRPPQ